MGRTKMSKIKCFKCKGKGYTGIKVNPLVAIATLGFGLAADTSDECGVCDGKGYLDE